MPATIISGETISLGGMYGSAKVVKISEDGVVLSVEKKIPQIEEANAPTAKKLPHSKRSAVKKEWQ